MSEQLKKKEGHFTFNGNYQPITKNTSLKINGESSNSCPSQKTHKKSKEISNMNATNLPINLFHSPGQYNKMIIRCADPHNQTYLEKQMGIVKTLQFVNQPFFQNEKQKRHERLKNYCEQIEKNKIIQKQRLKCQQITGNCCCCCCDDFCLQCAKATEACQISKQKKIEQKRNLLIDIDQIKKKVIERQHSAKNSCEKVSVQSHSRANKSSKNNFHIDMLINDTLFKEIQAKREKMLAKIDEMERQKVRERFNETVRKLNKQRARSAQGKPQLKTEPTKQHIREAYWNSVKDMIALQLEKDKISNTILSKKQKMQKKKMLKPTLQEIEFERFIVKKSNQALKQIKKQKEGQIKLQKIKAKKLLALAAEQAEILKRSKSKKFKPTQSMLQEAFKQID